MPRFHPQGLASILGTDRSPDLASSLAGVFPCHLADRSPDPPDTVTGRKMYHVLRSCRLVCFTVAGTVRNSHPLPMTAGVTRPPRVAAHLCLLFSCAKIIRKKTADVKEQKMLIIEKMLIIKRLQGIAADQRLTVQRPCDILPAPVVRQTVRDHPVYKQNYGTKTKESAFVQAHPRSEAVKVGALFRRKEGNHEED